MEPTTRRPEATTGAAGSRRWRTSLLLIVAAALSTLLLLFAAHPASADDDDDDGGENVARQIVVKMQPTANVGYINNKYNTRTIEALPGGERVYLLRTPAQPSPAALAARIERNEPQRVVYAEPNFTAGSPEGSKRHRAFPGGTPEPSPEAELYRTQYAVDALGLPDAHGISGGAGVVIAVVDTGVQANHPELSGRLTPARYDFVDNDRVPADVGNNRDDDRDGVRDEMEMVGHGTHVAGIAALAAPEARIMPVRALDSEGRGTTFGVARAITYAVRSGADVVNLSLGSSRKSELLEDLLEVDDDDEERGAIFVAAAGNDYNSAPQYPAAEDGAIAVTSVGEAPAGDEPAQSDFANFGRWVTIAAPGEGIYAPFPTGRYAAWDGTSMATPFVAGQAALIKSLRPAASPECVGGIIGETARPLTAADPTGTRLGSGHADAGAGAAYAADQTDRCPSGGDDD